jgi:hypothetical protein
MTKDFFNVRTEESNPQDKRLRTQGRCELEMARDRKRSERGGLRAPPSVPTWAASDGRENNTTTCQTGPHRARRVG